VLGVWHERVYVIPNAITLADPTQNARRELRQQWSLPEDAWVIGTIANLKPEKRVEFFLRVAISLLNLDSTNFHFIWIGEGPERLKAESILKALPHLATRIHFPGARLDIANCLAAFDAFVLTSAYEGLPNALLEAMAAGLPCVATDVPGTRDVLEAAPDLEIGLLADANDPARFADTLLELLQDRGRMQQLGQHARQHVRERYGEEAMVNRFCEVFSSVLNNGLTVGAPL
jgi:glycosyltransferase involved in cell wall biosynthesis